jgi:sulfur-oxidizing protein SoxY
MNGRTVTAGGMTRRQMVQRSLASATLLASAIAFGDERIERTRTAIEKLLGGREPEDVGITLKTPSIAENGNTVPVGVAVDAPFTADLYVKAIHLFAEENPTPEVASFFFTPTNGRASASTRIRLAKTQQVIAIAELSDGRILRTANEVKVTIGGCGG